MASPIIGQVLIFAGNFEISGWARCNGQLMSIAQNTALFSLLGTYYGGDGQTTFALPDLRGRVPIHQGQLQGGGNYTMGISGGLESVTLLTSQLPTHSHGAGCNTANGNSTDPTNRVWAAQPGLLQYGNAPNGAVMKANAVDLAGGSQPHDNMGPYLVLTYLIALEGIYPTRN